MIPLNLVNLFLAIAIVADEKQGQRDQPVDATECLMKGGTRRPGDEDKGIGRVRWLDTSNQAE